MVNRTENIPSPFVIPGIGLDEFGLIRMIGNEFDLPDDRWVTSKSRETRVKVARQLLMTCLIDHCDYSQRESGAVCGLNHATARHGKQEIFDTFWNDRQYGIMVKVVYNRCIEIKRRIMG
jgi:hypothetical protein